MPFVIHYNHDQPQCGFVYDDSPGSGDVFHVNNHDVHVCNLNSARSLYCREIAVGHSTQRPTLAISMADAISLADILSIKTVAVSTADPIS